MSGGKGAQSTVTTLEYKLHGDKGKVLISLNFKRTSVLGKTDTDGRDCAFLFSTAAAAIFQLPISRSDGA